MSRSLARDYRDIPRSPEALRRWRQDRFGRYAGYAEDVLFIDDFIRGSEKANGNQDRNEGL